MTHFSDGRRAEQAAAQYLQERNFHIVEQNWRTRSCEIDIVAKTSAAHYFVEVKYRRNPEYGNGLDYITAKKLKQMHYAAEMWMSQHHPDGDVRLAAMEVSGPEYEVTEFVELY